MAGNAKELNELFGKPECHACASAEQAARQFVKGVASDGVNDPKLRAAWRREGGLCREHWSVFKALEAPALPAAILARDLLEAGLRKDSVANSSETPKARFGIAAMRKRNESATGSCPACEIAVQAERLALGRMNRLRLPPSGLGQTRGFICLAHLGQVRNENLVAAVRERLDVLLNELDEFIRKSDYRFADEPRGAESDSWLRAIRVLAGR